MENQVLVHDQIKKVCIIIPVYNAEKYLGYCLNSILSQTYTNWNTILIDDGSTDGSLEICHNYAKLDARFLVYSKENGGVSSARNFGLRYAAGDYLGFVDSDDCLAPDALEKQVAVAVEKDSQLVVMDALIVDFQNPNNSHIMLNSSWLGQSPCILSSEEFQEKRMRLIWYTALLEGPWAKLYDLSLWKKLHLQFPEDMSLGEDFVTNMAYYAACNKVVFINECGYYYNQSSGSGSLSEKYRSDLFEVKMFLMKKLENHLGGREKLSEPERDAFDCYAASSGFLGVEQAVLASGMNEQQMVERLREMFADPLFTEAIRNAGYIPERFVACVEPALNGQFEKVIAHIAHKDIPENEENVVEQENQENQDASAAYPCTPGLLNRVMRKCMRLMVHILGNGGMSERLTRAEQEVAQYGLKLTWEKHARANRRISGADLENLHSQLNADNAAFAEQIEQNMAAQREQLEKMHSQLNADNAALTQRLDDKMISSKTEIIESVNGHAWTVEQRMTRYAYLRDINELRQRKKAIMLATAEHANIGDAAITLAEQKLLGAQFPEYFQVEISTYEFDQKEAYLHAIINSDDILFIHGGGNIGDLYLQEETLHRKIISEFPEHKVVILPQTISFSDIEQGRLELEKSERIYNRHKDLTIFVRGNTSLEFAKTHFAKAKAMLMPDAVHVLRRSYAFERSGALVCLRDDTEGSLDQEKKAIIADLAEQMTGQVEYRTNMHTEDISRDIRGLIVSSELMRFAKHQVVITDRLHGMIFSAITGTPCIVFSSYNHKIREYYETFFKDSNAVFFIGEDTEKLEEAIRQAMDVAEPIYPVFDSRNLNSMREMVTL